MSNLHRNVSPFTSLLWKISAQNEFKNTNFDDDACFNSLCVICERRGLLSISPIYFLLSYTRNEMTQSSGRPRKSRERKLITTDLGLLSTRRANCSEIIVRSLSFTCFMHPINHFFYNNVLSAHLKIKIAIFFPIYCFRAFLLNEVEEGNFC